MKRTMTISINPETKEMAYYYPESVKEIEKFIGGPMVPLMGFKSGDFIFVNSQNVGLKEEGDPSFQHSFVLFDWLAQTHLPLRVFGPALIFTMDFSIVGPPENEGVPFDEVIAEVKQTIAFYRFLISFPGRLENGFIEGIQN